MWFNAGPARNAWLASKRPTSASRSPMIFGRALPRARSATAYGSRSPATSASIMSRPDMVRVRLITVDIFDPGVFANTLEPVQGAHAFPDEIDPLAGEIS